VIDMKKTLILLLSLFTVFGLIGCEAEDDDDKRPTASGPIPGWDDPVYCNAMGYTYDSNELVYELVWSDEFDGDSLDLTKWTPKTNSGNANNELQYYTDHNTTVANGILTITAKLEEDNGYDYTSARLYTQGKADFTYGIFEIRAKIPSGVGTWPAIWMMPTTYRYGGWPDSGEIDIMEHVGYAENVLHSTIHTEAYNHKTSSGKGGTTYEYTDVTSEYHVYKVEWLPDVMKFSVDDKVFFVYRPSSYSTCPTEEEWPFDDDFYIILNVAIGGSWGGQQGVDDTMFPTSMMIDYVRVYQAEIITNIVQNPKE